MRRLRVSAWTLFMAGVVAGPVGAQVPVAPAGAAALATSSTAPVVTPAPYAWRGREAEIEAFLRTAPVTRFTEIPVGITKPRRGYFEPGGPVRSMAWKPLMPGRLHGKMESYRSEIAAYLLSRHLELHMVPPIVERQIGHYKGAAVYWIDGVRPWDPANPPKLPGAKWSRQTSRMMMFDQLVANIDRNQGNLLYDDDGNLYLIDHSRAFTPMTKLGTLKAPAQYCPELWARMAALTREDLQAVVGDWLDDHQIDALLKRRDEMARHLAAQVQARGEQVVFLPSTRH